MTQIDSDRFLDHCGLLHMRRFVDHISGPIRFIQLESQNQPTSRVTLWGEYHIGARVCPRCTQAGKCWYLPTLLHFTQDSTVIVAESDGHLDYVSWASYKSGDTHKNSMLAYAADHFTTSSSTVKSGFSHRAGFAHRHRVRTEGVAHPVKFEDGTERSVRYVMADLRDYPIPPLVYADIESRFPLHMALWANTDKTDVHGEHAYDILFGGGLGDSCEDVWQSCVPFAREIVRNTIGPSYNLTQTDIDQIAEDAYATLMGSFIDEFYLTRDVFNIVLLLFMPLMDIGSVLAIEHEVSVNQTALVHGLFGALHLDNVAQMLEKRGRFRITSYSGDYEFTKKMPSCLNVETMEFAIPQQTKAIRHRAAPPSTTSLAHPGVHVFRLKCAWRLNAGEYKPGTRLVVTDRKAAPPQATAVVNVNPDLIGPVNSSDALMQELLRVLHETTEVPQTWAVMTPEQAASFDRAMLLGFPPSDDRVGAFGAAVVEQFFGPGDWRGIVDKAVAAHVAHLDAAAKLLALPRRTAATYNAWVDYIRLLFVPITAACQYVAATATLTAAEQAVMVIVKPSQCSTTRALFEAMGASHPVAYERRVKQRV